MDLRTFRSFVASHHGVFSSAESARHGVDANRLQRMQANDEVRRVLPGVYRLEGTPRTHAQQISAVCKWAGVGSAASHRTAGGLLGLHDAHHHVIEITTHRCLRPPSERIRVYRRGRLPARDISCVQGIPVTTMPRTVIDLASVCGEEVVDVALDTAIRMGMRRRDFLTRLDELSAPGRNGIAVVRRLVAERVVEQGLTESPFERRLLRALRKARLPLPVCQFEISEGDFSARVDFAYPERGLVIEADSYRWHDGRAAWERDRARVSELASRGWRILLVTWLQLKYQSDVVLDRVRRALAVAR